MPIYKKHRALSEKTTSIEDPIEVMQRGVITFAPSKGTAFLIPTQIQNVVHLNITAMNLDAARSLGGSAAAAKVEPLFYSDYKLYHATNAASSGFGSLASAVNEVEVGKRLRLVDSKLYVAIASMAADYASDTVVLASTAYWRQLEEFASNAQKYLVVNVPNGASAYFKLKRQKISYEVVGYEY